MPENVENPSRFALSGTWIDARPLMSGLHVVATPIGNLADITLRALATLAAADVVLCEDTRHSARLLDHYGITTRREPLHQHNERARISAVLSRLEQGQAIALISDAGTPLLSDPGFPLVRAVREAGYDVFALPGPSALLAALVSLGLPTDRFTFVGFLPTKSAARARVLQMLAAQSETLVFYESPRRLGATLAAMAKNLGENRQVGVALELTKKFERTRTGTLAELTAQYSGDPEKGEAVIIVSGASEHSHEDENAWHDALEIALRQQSVRASVDEIAALYQVGRKKVYDAALKLKS